MSTIIDCPYCESEGRKSPIVIEPNLLLQGKSFSCSCCKSELSLKPQSADVFERHLKAYQNYQHVIASLQDAGNTSSLA